MKHVSDGDIEDRISALKPKKGTRSKAKTVKGGSGAMKSVAEANNGAKTFKQLKRDMAPKK